MPLRVIQEREPREVQQAGPALPVGTDNVRHRDLVVRIRTEVVLKYLQGIFGFDVDRLSKRGSIQIADR